MLRTLLLIILALYYTFSHAQTEKGRMMLGAQVNYYQNESEDQAENGDPQSRTKYSNLNLGLRGGYFFYDHVLIGLLFNFNSYEQINESISVQSAQTSKFSQSGSMNSPGVFVRYYKFIGKSRFSLFFQLDGMYGKGSSSSVSLSTMNGVVRNEQKFNTDDTQVRVIFNPGINYFITETIAVETYFGNFGYTYGQSKSFSDGILQKETSNSGFNAGLNSNMSNIFLGLTFYFGAKSQ